ncbi:MAG: ABC transporter permease subunit [Candidatus Brocadiae bacterium]|nr:ABC transporter permease subunit [Candidatus Brocadiia bacterium]
MSNASPSLLRLIARPLGRLAADRRLIWAVARNAIRQAIRVRAAFVIMAVYLLLTPALPFVLEGDGTLVGLLRLVIRYSLITAGVLLGLLTLVLSTTTLWSEIQQKQIYLLEARPIRRSHIVLGKLVGIMVVNAVLLLVMAITTAVCVEFLARQARWDDGQRLLARQQVLTARRAVQPEPVSEKSIQDAVDKWYDYLKEHDRLPAGVTEAGVKDARRKQLLGLYNTVPPRVVRIWQFRNVPRPRGEKPEVTIRFKYASSDRQSDSPVFTVWRVGRPNTEQFYVYRSSRKADEFHEIQIPADAVSEQGELEVQFVNLEPRLPTLIFAGDEAMQVLVRATSFAANLGRGVVLILTEVFFLAILGLFCSTFLTFPVSPIIALSLLLMISLAGTVKAEFEQGFSLADSHAEATQFTRIMEAFVKGVSNVVRVVFPPLDRYAASTRVSSGNEVPWPLVFEAVAMVGLVRGGLLLLLGIFIFERRELALATR